jgi:Ca-activated chloride channel family protein
MKLYILLGVLLLSPYITRISAIIQYPRSLVGTSLAQSPWQRRLDNTQPPTVDVSVDPACVDEEGSGGDEMFTLTLTVSGASGTSTTATPIDVVFAIDSSGSMKLNDSGGLRKTAAKSFVDKLHSSRDTAGVVSWDTNIDFTQALSSNFTTVKGQIGNVDLSGGTNLNVGLNSAISLLDSNTRTESSVKVIIFLTDSQGT